MVYYLGSLILMNEIHEESHLMRGNTYMEKLYGKGLHVFKKENGRIVIIVIKGYSNKTDSKQGFVIPMDITPKTSNSMELWFKSLLVVKNK